MKEDLSFEVYLDGTKLATTRSPGYLLRELSPGKHKAGVKIVFSSRITPLAELEFEVEGYGGIAGNDFPGWSIAPNPANDFVDITGDYDYLVIYDVSGTNVKRYTSGKRISVSELAAGLYFMKVVRGKESHTFKLIVDRDCI